MKMQMLFDKKLKEMHDEREQLSKDVFEKGQEADFVRKEMDEKLKQLEIQHAQEVAGLKSEYQDMLS